MFPREIANWLFVVPQRPRGLLGSTGREGDRRRSQYRRDGVECGPCSALTFPDFGLAAFGSIQTPYASHSGIFSDRHGSWSSWGHDCQHRVHSAPTG